VAHKIASPKNQPRISQVTVGQYWLGKAKLLDQHKMPSTSHYWFFKMYFYCNKDASLIFSLFDIASAREMPCEHTVVRTCNACFMYLPVSFFVFHSSLLTANSVNVVILCVFIFHNGYLVVLLCSGWQRSVIDTSLNWIIGVCSWFVWFTKKSDKQVCKGISTRVGMIIIINKLE